MAKRPHAPDPVITDEMKAAAERQIIEQTRRIDFYLTEYSLELLASKMRDREFEVPGYQRKFTWEDERKSRFIESILMGLPIPFLFFWERPDTGRLEIVDGSQRLRTIEEFIHGGLRLGELDGLPLLSGFTFADLTEARQRKVSNRSIRGIILNEHVDEEARFDMFDRINTGSKIANKAEVRRGALAGPFMSMVIRLASEPNFVSLAPMSKERVDLREREELVTRFFAYGDGLDGYKDRPAQFLFDYTKKMNADFTEDPSLEMAYFNRFSETMNQVFRIFPYGFRRNAKGKASPRARFEALALGTYLALQDRPHMVSIPVDPSGWLEGREFSEVIGSDGANAIARLRLRMEYVRDRLVEAVDGAS
ncbi:DUF262 domain-containing protein [Asaia sp. HN010]|uniref:DUF262 domain-containing protein n=1 Tax=Asaia sp. HN010 TaxID=3081233 RepID=UPI0030194201